MLGLMFLLAFLVYLAISIGIIVLAARWAKKRNRKSWVWGSLAAFVMYNIVFWDWIPTVVAHKYYCSTQAGFWVYKTLDQWKVENPGVMETLVANKGAPSNRQGDMTNYIDTYFLNQRFNWVVKHNGPLLFNRWRHEQEVIDAKSGEVLARYVDFSTAHQQREAGWSGWKFWLDSGFSGNRYCSSEGRDESSMRQFKNNFRGAEK